MEDKDEDIEDYSSDPLAAIRAVNAASEMLLSASNMMSEKNYAQSIEYSKGAIRLAASALLFHNKKISRTFDSTVSFIRTHYPDKFPLEDWDKIERMITGAGSGLLNAIVRAFGKPFQAKDAKYAYDVAKLFVENAKNEVFIN